MISSVFITTEHGKVILFRAYRAESMLYDATVFAHNVIKPKVEKLTPVKKFGFATYFIVESFQAYFVACCYGNVNAAAVLHCLNSIWQCLKDLFDAEITAERIQQNNSLVYEVLDLAIDGGYPQDFYRQLIESNEFREWAFVSRHESKEREPYFKEFGISVGQGLKQCLLRDYFLRNITPPSKTGYSKSESDYFWIRNGLWQSVNEYSTVISECLHSVFSYDGDLIYSEVKGSVGLHCSLVEYLAMEFAFNVTFQPGVMNNTANRDKQEIISDFKLPYAAKPVASILDFKLNQSVNIKTLKCSNTLHIHPIHGSSMLMFYRSDFKQETPVRIKPILTELAKNILHYRVTVNTLYHKKVRADELEISIPVPSTTASVEFLKHSGKCQHMSALKRVKWSISRPYGERNFEIEFQCKLYHSINECRSTLPPIDVTFSLPNYSFSGLYVKSIKTHDHTYTMHKELKYVARSGTFQHRLKWPTKENVVSQGVPI